MRFLALSALSALAFLSGCSHPQQTALAVLPTQTQVSRGEDRSAEFLRRFNELQTQPAAKWEDLSKYRVLIVHGLLGEVGIRFTRFLDHFDPDQRLVDYLKDQHKALLCAGVDVELLEHKSDSVARGGAVIAERILASNRPVLILSHSKGCLDTLEALRLLQCDGKLDKVAGWIALQGPFKGAPEADRITTNDTRRFFTRIALNCLGAHSCAIKDMTTSTRDAYFAEHREEIDRITHKVPMLSFASLNPAAKDAGTDGSVPVESALLPGSDFIAVNGLSHSAPVISKPRAFNRAALTHTLIDMLLTRVEPAGEIVAR